MFKNALFIKISYVQVNINSSKIVPANATLSSVLYQTAIGINKL